MKIVSKLTVLALALSAASLASAAVQVLPRKAQSEAAVKQFNKSGIVLAELNSLKGKMVGKPVVVRLAGMGDGCDMMESYMVIQHIAIKDNFGQSTLAARMAVTSTDMKCATDGKKAGTKITISDIEIAKLNQ